MTGQSFIEEIDCASFFDHIDDLIEFPPVSDTSLNSVDCSEFANIWTTNSDDLQVSDPIFCGSNSDTSLNSVDCNEFANIWTNNSDDLQVSDPIFCGSNSDNASALSAELDVPYEDIVQLEWLSNFVEDSFSGGGMTINKEKLPVQKETVVVHHQFQTSSPISVLESSCSSSSSSSYSASGSGKINPLNSIQRGPQRARTKRPRPTTFNPQAMIELLSPLVFIPVSSSSESEKNFTSRCGSNSVTGEPDEKKKKKQKKPKIQLAPTKENDNQNENQNENQSGQGVRKCMHCEITKTPQWRAGPMGPKSLCNACGVRYKSGRLFPEYRPAASPTFVPTLHSNSHKKVVEMRTKFGPNDIMEIAKTEPEPEPELIPNINHGPDYI